MSRVGEALRETRSSLTTVFGNAGLRRVNLAFAGSAIGDWAYATAIVVWAYGVGGVALVGIWGTIRLILLAVVTPFASVLVDRFPRKRVMVACDLTRFALVLLISALIAAHAPTLVIVSLATCVALVSAPFRPAVAALLPNLVESPEELTAANGTASTIESLAFFVGPALGGLLLTFASVPVVGVFDAVTFLWSALLVSRIRVPHKDVAVRDASDRVGVGQGDGVTAVDGEKSTAESVPGDPSPRNGRDVDASPGEKEGFLAESTAGFRAINADKDVRLVTLVYCAQTIVAGASIVFGVEIAVQMTDFGSTGVGYLDSMLGVGAILGGLVAIGRATARRIATDFGCGVIFWALPLLLAAAWPHMGAAFAAMFVIGFANPIVDVNASTILQRLTPDEVMGRVFGALETGLIAAMALGSVIMPILLHFVGLRWSLAILGIAITLIVLPTLGRLRVLDHRLGDNSTLELLRQVPLFAPLEAKSLERIARQMGRLEVAQGQTVIGEGEAGDRFYVVESGRTTASHDGVPLSSQGPGDPFGEIALLRDVPRTATVTADEDSVLLYLERDAFLEAVTGNGEVSSRADDLIARRIPTY
jgi:MFS family permease